jgi:Tat protein secretion system quality control protein TatD with DNase activity
MFGRPRDLAVVAASLAELRGVALSEVAARTHENALALFGS